MILKRGRTFSNLLMWDSSVAVSRHTRAAGSSEEPVSQSPDLDCLRAGISMGVPVSDPLRTCDRYQAAWLSLKADLGNSALTATMSSSLVTALFAVSCQPIGNRPEILGKEVRTQSRS